MKLHLLCTCVALGACVPSSEPFVGDVSDAVTAPARVRADITHHGEVILREVGERRATTLDESMRRLAYAQGAMHWKLAPLITMMTLTVNSTRTSSALNISALDALLASTDPRYRGELAAGNPLLIGNDGTLPAIAAQRHYEDIVALHLRLGVPDAARRSLAQLDPAARAIAEAWLRGAQDMARKHAKELYSANPGVAETGVLKHFLQMTVVDIMEHYAASALLYDFGGLIGTMQAFTANDWMRGESIVEASTRAVEAIGASNGWSFTYVDAATKRHMAITGGEPHQPSGPPEQPKIFLSYLTDDHGDTQPMVGVAQGAGVGGPLLTFSRNHGLSGTAGPSAGSLQFFVETNQERTHYRWWDGSWRPFATRELVVPHAGGTRAISIHSVGAGEDFFGDVFLFVRDPDTGTHYAITQRLRNTTHFYGTVVDLARAGVANDETRFVDALSRGLPHYGAAGSYRKQDGIPKSFVALFQGHQDVVVDDDGVQGFALNPVAPEFRKRGEHTTPYCADLSVGIANNGPLNYGGCPKEQTWWPDRLDPGYPTIRQEMVKDFARDRASQPIAREEVYRFATSTQSYQLERIAESMLIAVMRYGDLHLPVAEAPIVRWLAQALIGNDGATRDTPFPLFFLHVRLALEPILYAPVPALSATVQRFLREPGVTIDELSAALDDTSAKTLLTLYADAVRFYFDRCAPQGIDTWNKAVHFVHEGEVVAENVSGPGFGEAINLAGYQFAVGADGAQSCRVESYHSSPVKFVQMGDEEFCYLPFGSTVDRLSVEPGMWRKARDAWAERWKRLNPGKGYDSEHAYRCLSLSADAPSDELLGEVVASYTFDVR